MTRCLTDMVRIELHFLSFFSGYAEHPVESQVPSEGLNTGPLQWKNSVLTTELPGSSQVIFSITRTLK